MPLAATSKKWVRVARTAPVEKVYHSYYSMTPGSPMLKVKESRFRHSVLVNKSGVDGDADS